MQLYLKNIGKLKEADIALKGITVIAGQNDTGKSTVGKVLFSVFNSYKNIERKILDERAENINNLLDNCVDTGNISFILAKHKFDTLEITSKLLENSEKYTNDDILKADLYEMLNQYESEPFYNDTFIENIDGTILKIREYLTIPDERIIEHILSKNLYSEFGEQICNVHFKQKSEIRLTIKSKSIKIVMSNNTIEQASERFSLNTEVIYIDDPFILDEKRRSFIRNSYSYEHRQHLRNKLFYNLSDNNILDEIRTSDKLKEVFKNLYEVCDGDIERNRLGMSYKKAGFKNGLEMNNISTGLKTFIIIKMLLENGSIKDSGTIVLDEPEVHLHPEWQLVFAEIIVLLQKEFDMHILLNTHSPYFLNAIEVYSKKYGIADKCKYYLSENDPKKPVSTIVDVTDETEKIYSKLYRPLQVLENEEYDL